MEYIVVLDADSKGFSIIEDNNGFAEKFSSYDDAKKEAESWKEVGDCQAYSIFALCTDERNHVI